MHTQNNDQLLTRKEVAEKFRITYPTLKAWRDKGFIAAHKLGRTVRFKTEDVEEAIRRAKQ